MKKKLLPFFTIISISTMLISLISIIPTRGQSASTRAETLVLVNSTSASYPDFNHYLLPYLDHFGLAYTILDISNEPLPADLFSFALIIVGHKQLDEQHVYLDAVQQQNITNAVSQGTGLVNFDSSLTDANLSPLYPYVQNLFGFDYFVAVPSANVGINSSAPLGKYIVSLQSINAAYTMKGSITPVGVSAPGDASILATVGSQPFIIARNYGQGRVVQWTSYDWLDIQIWGHFRGFDDLIWRSFVWAARKPFVMQGIPPFFTMRVDDVTGPMLWAQTANEFGIKPFLGVFIGTIDDNAAADISGLVNSGLATASIHSFTVTNKFYFSYSDAQMAANYAAGTQWHQFHDIPISKIVVPHYYEIGANAFDGLSNWGVEYIATQMIPGNFYSNYTPWLMLGPYRKYQEGISGNNRIQVFYADYLPIPGHPEYDGRFFNCVTETRDLSYEWAVNSNVSNSVNRGTRQLKRSLDSMTLPTLFTHEYNIIPIPNDTWRSILQGIVDNLASYHPIFVTLDEACQYLRATRTSNISTSSYSSGTQILNTTLIGGTDIQTAFYLFTELDGVIEYTLVIVPAFSGSIQVDYPLAPGAQTPTTAPTSTPTYPPAATRTSTVTPAPSETSTPIDTQIPPTATATEQVTPTPTETQVPPTVTLIPTDAQSTPTATHTLTASATPTVTNPPTITPAPTATVLPDQDMIFVDGFESGDLSAWSSAQTNGDLAVTSSAIVGSYGLRVLINDTIPLYVRDDTPFSEIRYQAGFYFDPNSILMANNDNHQIFRAYSGSSNLAANIGFRYSGGQYYIQPALVEDSGNIRSGTAVSIADAPQFIEIVWVASPYSGANSGYMGLWINGVQVANLTSIDNDTLRIDQVRLGPVAGIDNGTGGTYYFDEFKSLRETYVGP